MTVTGFTCSSVQPETPEGVGGGVSTISFKGTRKTLSLGTYPDTGLATARRKADKARRLVGEGFDPSDQRKAEKAATKRAREDQRRIEAGLPPENSFEAVAREWYAGWAPTKAPKPCKQGIPAA